MKNAKLHFYCLVSKITEKLENHKLTNNKMELNNMGQAMDIENVNQFNLSKEENEEFWQYLNEKKRIFIRGFSLN